jgi:hypothetical protein
LDFGFWIFVSRTNAVPHVKNGIGPKSKIQNLKSKNPKSLRSVAKSG